MAHVSEENRLGLIGLLCRIFCLFGGAPGNLELMSSLRYLRFESRGLPPQSSWPAVQVY